MARKKTSEFDDMTLRQIKAYSDQHPSEGLRLGDSCDQSKKYCVQNYWQYRKEEVINRFIPGFLKDDEILHKV